MNVRNCTNPTAVNDYVCIKVIHMVTLENQDNLDELFGREKISYYPPC